MISVHRVDGRLYTNKQTGENCSAYALQSVLRYYGVSLDPELFYEQCLEDEVTDLLNGCVTPYTMKEKLEEVLAKDKRGVEFLKDYEMEIRTGGTIVDLTGHIFGGEPVIVIGRSHANDRKAIDNLHYMVVTGFNDKSVFVLDSSFGDRFGDSVEFYNREISEADFMEMWAIGDCKCGIMRLDDLAKKELGIEDINGMYIFFKRRLTTRHCITANWYSLDSQINRVLSKYAYRIVRIIMYKWSVENGYFPDDARVYVVMHKHDMDIPEELTCLTCFSRNLALECEDGFEDPDDYIVLWSNDPADKKAR